MPKTIVLGLLAAASGLAQTAPRAAGTVSKVDAAAKQILLKSDAGVEITVFLVDSTKYLRVPPNADIKAAAEIALSEVTVGDRVVATGKTSEDGKSTLASRVLIMTKDDVVKKQQMDQDDWNRRGISGTVASIDAAGKRFVLNQKLPDGTSKPITVVITAKTQMRRYAPDSIKYANAKIGGFGDVMVGDQARALGNRSDDGAMYAAEEVLSGAFRTLAATIVSIDEAAGTLRVTDLDSKKPATVKILSDTNLRRMPAQMAAQMATRAAAMADAAAGKGPAPAPTGGPGGPGGGPGGPGGGRGGRGGSDVNQMIERMPNFKLSELKPGDALIISASKGSDPGAAMLSAITMIAGVEPVLSAVPASQRPMLLGNWSVDAGGGGGTP